MGKGKGKGRKRGGGDGNDGGSGSGSGDRGGDHGGPPSSKHHIITESQVAETLNPALFVSNLPKKLGDVELLKRMNEVVFGNGSGLGSLFRPRHSSTPKRGRPASGFARPLQPAMTRDIIRVLHRRHIGGRPLVVCFQHGSPPPFQGYLATIVPEHGVRMTCHMLEEVLAAMSNKPLIDDCVPFGQDLLPEKAVQDEPESEEATTKRACTDLGTPTLTEANLAEMSARLPTPSSYWLHECMASQRYTPAYTEARHTTCKGFVAKFPTQEALEKFEKENSLLWPVFRYNSGDGVFKHCRIQVRDVNYARGNARRRGA